MTLPYIFTLGPSSTFHGSSSLFNGQTCLRKISIFVCKKGIHEIVSQLMASPLKHVHPCLVPYSGYDSHKTRLFHPTRGGQSLENGQAKSSLGHGIARVSIC